MDDEVVDNCEQTAEQLAEAMMAMQLSGPPPGSQPRTPPPGGGGAAGNDCHRHRRVDGAHTARAEAHVARLQLRLRRGRAWAGELQAPGGGPRSPRPRRWSQARAGWDLERGGHGRPGRTTRGRRLRRQGRRGRPPPWWPARRASIRGRWPRSRKTTRAHGCSARRRGSRQMLRRRHRRCPCGNSDRRRVVGAV